MAKLFRVLFGWEVLGVVFAVLFFGGGIVEAKNGGQNDQEMVAPVITEDEDEPTQKLFFSAPTLPFPPPIRPDFYNKVVDALDKSLDALFILCGDGVVDPGEQCDDASSEVGDGCTDACKLENLEACGNGVVDPGETCDDGNLTDGDDCSGTCQQEEPVMVSVTPSEAPSLAPSDSPSIWETLTPTPTYSEFVPSQPSYEPSVTPTPTTEPLPIRYTERECSVTGSIGPCRYTCSIPTRVAFDPNTGQTWLDWAATCDFATHCRIDSSTYVSSSGTTCNCQTGRPASGPGQNLDAESQACDTIPMTASCSSGSCTV